jgi:hypothetical protein
MSATTAHKLLSDSILVLARGDPTHSQKSENFLQ